MVQSGNTTATAATVHASDAVDMTTPEFIDHVLEQDLEEAKFSDEVQLLEEAQTSTAAEEIQSLHSFPWADQEEDQALVEAEAAGMLVPEIAAGVAMAEKALARNKEEHAKAEEKLKAEQEILIACGMPETSRQSVAAMVPMAPQPKKQRNAIAALISNQKSDGRRIAQAPSIVRPKGQPKDDRNYEEIVLTDTGILHDDGVLACLDTLHDKNASQIALLQAFEKLQHFPHERTDLVRGATMVVLETNIDQATSTNDPELICVCLHYLTVTGLGVHTVDFEREEWIHLVDLLLRVLYRDLCNCETIYCLFQFVAYSEMRAIGCQKIIRAVNQCMVDNRGDAELQYQSSILILALIDKDATKDGRLKDHLVKANTAKLLVLSLKTLHADDPEKTVYALRALLRFVLHSEQAKMEFLSGSSKRFPKTMNILMSILDSSQGNKVLMCVTLSLVAVAIQNRNDYKAIVAKSAYLPALARVLEKYMCDDNKDIVDDVFRVYAYIVHDNQVSWAAPALAVSGAVDAIFSAISVQKVYSDNEFSFTVTGKVGSSVLIEMAVHSRHVRDEIVAICGGTVGIKDYFPPCESKHLVSLIRSKREETLGAN